jgi:hypothetical protein
MATVIHAVAESAVFPRDAETAGLFAANFDRHPFQFRHALNKLEIFQMPALLKLAEHCMRKREAQSHFEIGESLVNGYFGKRPTDVTLVEALERIGEGDSWIALKRVHEVPDYRAALEQMISELSELTATNLRRTYHDPILTIFITSPNRITPYHMDGETNFLAQVQGSKSVFVYDAHNPRVLTAEDMEKFWTGHLQAPKWNKDLSEGKWSYELSPGLGVFHPLAFPHWVKNGNNVSISLSINFKQVRNDAIGAYRTNYYARKIGLHPTEPGRSPALDRLKSLSFGMLYKGAQTARRVLRSR